MRSFGLRVGVRVSDRSVLDEVRECLPAGWVTTPAKTVDAMYSLVVGGPGRRGVRRYHLLYAGAIRVVRTHHLAAVFANLQTDMERYVAAKSPRRVFVHAGAVGWRGRAVVIPGASFSGKSTLVRALLEEGATYYSDEYAVIDGRGRVHPYPRSLGVRDERGRREELSPEELGAPIGKRPLPIALIVMTDFRPGAATRRLRRVSPGRAVLGLLEHTVGARTYTERALCYLKRLAAEVPTVRGPRGEASEVAPELLRRLEAAKVAPARSSDVRLATGRA